jgi:hypothetical protein
MSGGTGCGPGPRQGLGYVVDATWALQVAQADSQAAAAALDQAHTRLGNMSTLQVEEEDTAADVCRRLCLLLITELVEEGGYQDPSQRPKGARFDSAKLVHAGGTMDVERFGQHVAPVSSEARVIFVRSLCRAC